MTERKVTLESIAKDFIAEQEGDSKLAAQLVLSLFMQRVQRELSAQPETVVVDREKGLRLIRGR